MPERDTPLRGTTVVYVCPDGHVSSVHRPNNGDGRCFFCGKGVDRKTVVLDDA